MYLSIVTTLYRSSEYIEEFVRRISAEAEAIHSDYEIIMVDDGSPDHSLDVALNLAKDNSHIKVIELARNFGHHKAMMTGLDHAQGELVFLIDVDLEEPPELLGEFYREWKQANGDLDVIYGFQKVRKGKWFERYSGVVAWWLINRMLPINIPRNHSTVRLMTKTYVQSLTRHKEHKTAIGGLWVLTGFRQKSVPFQKHSRSTSSYTVWSRFHLLIDSITSFSEIPLIFILYLGIFVLLVSGIFAFYLVFHRLMGHITEGWTSVMVSVWFFGGMIIFCIGILGLYISRIFIETKQRPYSIIRNIYKN